MDQIKVYASLASLPCYAYERAIVTALDGMTEPTFGTLATDHLQLCPQNTGRLTEELATQLAERYTSRLRLHANVYIMREMRMVDASNYFQNQDWFQQAARISSLLNAPAYTMHAGSRANCTLRQMFEHVRAIQDKFDCPVGVEGMYPARGGSIHSDKYLLSTWEEYSELLESGLNYALDLSHLNILARHTRKKETNLVSELLASERCIEIHVSHNDGFRDSHQVMPTQGEAQGVWWYPLLAPANPNAIIFSEGNQREQMKMAA